MLAEAPDVVFIATGGVPNTEVLRAGNDLVVSTWDILSGAGEAGGARAGVRRQRRASRRCRPRRCWREAGSAVEIVSPERFFAPEMGGMNHALYAARVPSARRARHHQRAAAVGAARGQRTGARRSAAITAPARGAASSIRWWSSTARCRPTSYIDALRPLSLNLGEVDYEALVAGRPQEVVAQSRRKIPAVPHRRRGRQPQHPRRDL